MATKTVAQVSTADPRMTSGWAGVTLRQHLDDLASWLELDGVSVNP
jgi:hypothetical protein